MSRAGTVLPSFGVVLFIALLSWQGFGSVATALAAAGWGLFAVAAFYLLPVMIDALAIETLFPRHECDVSFRDALLARWTDESVNSLMPAGQIGGPMLMVRYLSQRGMRARDAAAVIIVSTTMQSVGQVIFAMIGLALLSSCASGVDMPLPVLIVIVVCSLMVVGFFFAQRKGLFARATRFASQFAARFSKKRDWSSLVSRAEAVDTAVVDLYKKPGPVAVSFALSLLGWMWVPARCGLRCICWARRSAGAKR